MHAGLVISEEGDLVDTKTGKVINEFGATRFDVAVRALRGELDPAPWVEVRRVCSEGRGAEPDRGLLGPWGALGVAGWCALVRMWDPSFRQCGVPSAAEH